MLRLLKITSLTSFLNLMTVVKLDSKGVNDSFMMGVDFHMKDKLMNGSVLPKNVQIKHFLPRRTSPKLEVSTGIK